MKFPYTPFPFEVVERDIDSGCEKRKVVPFSREMNLWFETAAMAS